MPEVHLRSQDVPPLLGAFMRPKVPSGMHKAADALWKVNDRTCNRSATKSPVRILLSANRYHPITDGSIINVAKHQNDWFPLTIHKVLHLKPVRPIIGMGERLANPERIGSAGNQEGA